MSVKDLIDQPDVMQNVPVEDIPALLGELEALKARLWARLVAASGNRQGERSAPADRRLSVAEAAAKLGTSRDWLYRRSRTLPFVIRLGRSVGYSEAGIEKYLRQRAGR